MDPIADMLTCLRNANAALLPEVVLPHSRMKEGVARILRNEGYVVGYAVEGDLKKRLKVRMKFKERKRVIARLKRVSRPGLRRYVDVRNIPRVLGGMGICILSTSRGLMTGREARKNNLGGEVVCYVW